MLLTIQTHPKHVPQISILQNTRTSTEPSEGIWEDCPGVGAINPHPKAAEYLCKSPDEKSVLGDQIVTAQSH
jgi:hypothetical protein